MRLIDKIALRQLIVMIIGLISKLIDKMPSKSKTRRKK